MPLPFKEQIVQGKFEWVRPTSKKPSNVIRHDTPSGRYYEIAPNVYYPSITTVLNRSGDFQWWRDAKGEVEANRILKTAGARGSQMHSLLDRYLSNDKISLNEENPPIKFSFLNGQSTIDRISNIQFKESILWSNRLKIAGQVDLIGNFDDELSVIDFKTSNKVKEKSDITNYFLQATAYQQMAEERYEFLKIKKIVIMIFVDNVKEPFVFIESPDVYIGILETKRNEFTGVYNV